MGYYNQHEDSKDYFEVNESVKEYARNIDKKTNLHVNPKNINFSNFFENKMLVIKAIRFGIPQDVFEKIQQITPFSENDWAEYLDVSKKTLQRHRNDKNYAYKSIHTEKILELAEVTLFGKAVFDDTDQFYRWLNTPSYALGHLKPAELLKDSYGKELVMRELNNIEYGVFA
mgnify:FL=1